LAFVGKQCKDHRLQSQWFIRVALDASAPSGSPEGPQKRLPAHRGREAADVADPIVVNERPGIARFPVNEQVR
jgi:hypothetical protein